MKKILVVCETTAAISMHLREIGDTVISYSGFAVRPKTLCNGEAAWDTKIPVACASCSTCIRIAIERQLSPQTAFIHAAAALRRA